MVLNSDVAAYQDMYLGSLHAVVVAELPAVAAGELFERFVGWAR
ncbi:hypothetical protein OHB44_00225 [Micromonospora sp. NBC_00821]|nr:hypothetical protein OHB44_00225 [Micromonospora sp. NBC_00821]